VTGSGKYRIIIPFKVIMMDENVELKINGKMIELPVVIGTEAEKAVDITELWIKVMPIPARA